MKEFPKWIYKDGKSLLINTPEEHGKYQAEGWTESPAIKAAPKPEDKLKSDLMPKQEVQHPQQNFDKPKRRRR